jgi:Fe-S cluster biogenesis protein NfuA
MEKLIEKIEEALEQIRPFLREDGGDVKIVELKNYDEVVVEFVGACSSCTMNGTTFKAGVEEAILKSVPEIKKVTALNVIGV